MTDKEMAVDWIRSQGWSEENLPSDEFGQMLKAYLAGLKADKPKWHKVADGDLPKETGFIESDVLLLLVQLKGTKYKIYELGWYNFSGNMFVSSHLKVVKDVVAWCEIPKYEEEEKYEKI